MWKARSLYRLKSGKTVARELARYRLGSVGVQEVKWDKGGQATVKHPVSNRFFLHQQTISAVKTIEFLTYRVSYTECLKTSCHKLFLGIPHPHLSK
jgi:hypothetical protein